MAVTVRKKSNSWLVNSSIPEELMSGKILFDIFTCELSKKLERRLSKAEKDQEICQREGC